ncbi:response regulator [uncultured Draconibacterium sp.]|uniref:LytR/AlgR family response regulator transcription factor n=1 Tax=uncultured Draconibacterium sp. TaxID=1573823 RepID=UPI0029C8D1A4|nr:response regulator [uncultured Draconibacterium sp.]
MKSTPKFRTIIADDELLARERLKKLLTPFSQTIEIIGEAQNGIECKRMINEMKPDLIFLDIQMPGLNGFEVLQQINHSPLVIFCTAHDEFALKAFETYSVDYLVKPVKAERIERSIEKLMLLNLHRTRQELLNLIKELTVQLPANEITTIPVKLGNRMLILNIEDISFFQAEEKYVTIHSINGKRYTSDISLKDLEEKLVGNFIRIQRALLVNKVLVKEIIKHTNSRYKIRMNDVNQSLLISGRNYINQIKSIV